METLRLADGTLIATGDGKRTVNTEINDTFSDEPQSDLRPSDDFVLGKRRYLDDLPMPFMQSKPVAIIAAYTMFGLTSADISRTLNVPSADIVAVKNSRDYKMFMDGILQNVREHDENRVRRKLNKNAKHAANTIVALMESENEKIKLAASKDILDRTGHRPADKIEHTHAHEGGFTIRVIKDAKKAPTIDLEMNDGER